MPRWQRVYLAACGGVIGFALAYVCCDWGAWPRLFYLPDRRQWRLLAAPPDNLAMGYVGLVLWGLGGGLVGLALVAAIAGRFRKPAPPALLRLAGGWALTAIALAGAYFTWNLWPWG